MRALFLDRDGVINKQIVDGYVLKTEQFVFHDKVIEALQRLHQLFDRVVLVTNQQCVGKGLCTEAQIADIHAWMQEQLRLQHVAFNGIYCCPHLATAKCDCRKPQPGMALQAQRDFPEIELSRSVMVGDALSDMQFAVNAGLLPVHVGAVRVPEFEAIQTITPYHYDSLWHFSLSSGSLLQNL